MTNSKLNLDQAVVNQARSAARRIALDVKQFIEGYTTTSVERTVARLLGIDGVNSQDVPLANVVVEQVQSGGKLDQGLAYWLGNAMAYLGMTPQEIAQGVARGDIKLTKLPIQEAAVIKETIDTAAAKSLQVIKDKRNQRAELMQQLPLGERPHLYVIVATGNIYEDVVQARSAALQGADIIAVIRTTGQSLLDYVPYGATTEGFGGTYATQENFSIMRQALDEVGAEVGRYIQLVNYCSGLCMPEIAAMGAFERLDMMLNDAMYGILFRDINMQRTFIDQHFSRMLNSYAGITINTGEDNYLTTADAFTEAHTVLASQLINEQLALLSGLSEEQMGLGHAYEMDPAKEDGFLLEVAQAQMAREIFPKAPLKYMPPTKHMTGDIFRSHTVDTMFNLASVLTSQGIHLVGMLTEAIHTPLMHDRALSIENAKFVMNNARHLAAEIEFKAGGQIQQRAQLVLAKACQMLLQVSQKTLPVAIEEGMFAAIKRSREGGKGLEGVLATSEDYYNPFAEMMSKELIARKARRSHDES